MPSIVPGFEYDIFISYRQKDNKGDRWVTEFVSALKSELDATFKEDISIYFDENPHDGLRETHDVDESLKEKLKCVIFIPIVSQTYCDPKSFAWRNEFLAFKKLATEDRFGLKIKLQNGNVASRVLPIRIHDLDDQDNATLEDELGSIRAIDFIFKSVGVNRPLRAMDDYVKEISHSIFYRDQINKTANAIKELIAAMSDPLPQTKKNEPGGRRPPLGNKKNVVVVSSLVASILLLLFFYFTLFNAGVSNDKSIAVLPFVNMSNDPNQEYFSDGMTDEVLNRLYMLGDLKVISRTSSMKFKGAKLTAKEIADQLHVTKILEGSVQKEGKKIKVTVQLIDAQNDNHLWSETYEKELTDVFALQSEIAIKVAGELKLKFSSFAKHALEKPPTSNPVAYEYLLKGNSYWLKDIDNSINLFTKAIQADSLYEEAWYARANANLFLVWRKVPNWEEKLQIANNDIQFMKEKFPEALPCKRAIAMHHYWVNRDYDAALKLYREILTDNPGDEETKLFVANILRRTGHWKESLKAYENVLKVDPLNNDKRNQLIGIYYQMHRPAMALKEIKFGLSIEPELNFFRTGIPFTKIMMGNSLAIALQESKVSEEEWSNLLGYDFVNKGTSILEARRKKGDTLRSSQTSYRPISLDYALTYHLQHNTAVAKTYADSAIQFLSRQKLTMGEDPRVYASLGFAYAIKGDHKLGIENGLKAIELLPISKDAVAGPDFETNLAKIYIILREYDLALGKIENILKIPSSLSVGWMNVDPVFEPVRNLPKFKTLAEEYEYDEQKDKVE